MKKKVPKLVTMGPDSKEAKREQAKSRAFMRKVASPYAPGRGKSRRVYQSNFGVCARPIWFFTGALGPCIGLCIAWNGWAAMAHSDWIDMNQCENVTAVIQRAKNAIPSESWSSIHPVVCGGGVTTDIDVGDPYPDETLQSLMESRARIVEILCAAGFAAPHIRWYEENEVTFLVANLSKGEIEIRNKTGTVARWPIAG